jgi:hypothetical protein
MLRVKRLLATLAFALFSLAAAPAHSGVITGTFGAPNFQWIHSGGAATPNHIWVAGDEWAQTFTGTGLPSATAMLLHIFIDDNILNGPSLILDVLLNGVDVGDMVIAPGATGGQNFTFNFASILGDTYTIAMVVRNTVSPGLGSVSMLANNQSSGFALANVPEPATLLLLTIALGGLVVTRRRV